MRYILHVNTTFSTTRSLRDYVGACSNVHRYNFKIEAKVITPEPDKKGLVIDFYEIKVALESMVEKFNHHYMNEISPFDKINPTSENLSKYFFENLTQLINHPLVKVKELTVWESEEAGVTYSEE